MKCVVRYVFAIASRNPLRKLLTHCEKLTKMIVWAIRRFSDGIILSQKVENRKKVRQTKSATKVMMLVFFDHEGVIYQHEVPHGVTVNADHYITALKTLKIHISRKRRHLVGKWILHHDNARPHTAARVLEFLTKSKITVMKHPPYSPDLAPCDFWMFPKLKEALRGQTFSSYQDIVTAVQGYFNTLDKNAFSTCFQKWILRWDRCIEAGGRYFEKE